MFVGAPCPSKGQLHCLERRGYVVNLDDRTVGDLSGLQTSRMNLERREVDLRLMVRTLCIRCSSSSCATDLRWSTGGEQFLFGPCEGIIDPQQWSIPLFHLAGSLNARLPEPLIISEGHGPSVGRVITNERHQFWVPTPGDGTRVQIDVIGFNSTTSLEQDTEGLLPAFLPVPFIFFCHILQEDFVFPKELVQFFRGGRSQVEEFFLDPPRSWSMVLYLIGLAVIGQPRLNDAQPFSSPFFIGAKRFKYGQSSACRESLHLLS